MKRYFVVLLAGLVSAAPSQSQQFPTPSAESLTRALQAKYDRVRTFSADFVHTYQGGVLRQTATERGHVLVSKPGKMQWEYTDPERKLFVSDGHKLYAYIPQDKQVIVSDVPDEDHATTGALFLAGKGNLPRDFAASYTNLEGVPAGTTVVKLSPRHAEPEYDWLAVAIDPKTLQIRALVTVDHQGGRSTLSFTNVKENLRIADKEFTFSIPRGVDVITASAASQ